MRVDNILQSSQVRLSAWTTDDLPTIAGWYQDAGFMRLLDARPAAPKSKDELENYFSEQRDANTAFLFAIRLVEDDALIGYAELDGILWAHRAGWLSLGLGNRAQWGRGYGRSAMDLLLDFAFNELNLYRLQLTVFSYNERAIRLYERSGFQREGVYREFLQRDGERYDMFLYGLLVHEWRQSMRDRGAI